ncbi:MAG: hypothetical protein L0Y35_02055 [Flammeovirgaceae bacterium]|nr:hypothetical protein [Flammeovirgaceae bacterium]
MRNFLFQIAVLGYFRINDPYRLLGLFLILLMVALPTLIDWPGLTHLELHSFLVGEKMNDGFSMYSEIADHTPPLAAWLYEAFDFVFGRSVAARHIMAFMLIYFLSCFVGFFFINRKAFGENTYVPSLIFGLLMLLSFDTLVLSADLFQLVFLLLALNNLIKIVEFREQRDETIFNLGLFLSGASLCSAYSLINLPGSILILILFTRTSLRLHLLMLFGFLLPHLILITLAYWRDTLPDFLNYYYIQNILDTTGSLLPWTNYFLLGAVPLFFMVISLIIVNREARTTKYQSQVLQVLLVWMGFSFLQIYLTPSLRPQNFIILAPSFTFFITHFFLLIRRRRFAGLNTWILFFGVIATHYLVKYDFINQIDTSHLLVKAPSEKVKEKILVLTKDSELYQSAEAGSPFFNWRFAESIFNEMDYYENVLKADAAFRKELPRVIIDPESRMQKVFERIPWIEKKYQQKGKKYILNLNAE